MEYRVTLTYDKYDGQYRANLYKRKTLWRWSWWKLKYSIPNYYFRSRDMANYWATHYNVKVEDLT